MWPNSGGRSQDHRNGASTAALVRVAPDIHRNRLYNELMPGPHTQASWFSLSEVGQTIYIFLDPSSVNLIHYREPWTAD